MRASEQIIIVGDSDALGGGPSASLWRPNLTDIPGLLFWFDTTDVTKISVDTNNGIDLFIPQIGDTGLFTMAQPVEAERPISVQRAPFQKRIVRFPASDNRWLGKSTAMDFTTGATTVIAWNAPSPLIDGRGAVFSLNSGGTHRLALQFQNTPPAQLRYQFGQGTFGLDFRPFSLDQWHISTTRGRESWLDGGALQTLSDGTITTSATIDIHYGRQGFNFLNGDLGHWLCIIGPVTDEMLRRIEGFVAWDLGVEASLVPGHPWRNAPP
jgi:hypothetical protein